MTEAEKAEANSVALLAAAMFQAVQGASEKLSDGTAAVEAALVVKAATLLIAELYARHPKLQDEATRKTFVDNVGRELRLNLRVAVEQRDGPVLSLEPIIRPHKSN